MADSGSQHGGPGPVNQFGTPVAVNQFGTPVAPGPGAPQSPYPPLAGTPYAGSPRRRTDPRFVLGVLVAGAVLVAFALAGVGVAVHSALATHSGHHAKPAAVAPILPADSHDTPAKSLTAPGPPAGSVILDPTTAQDILDAIWPARESALTSRDVGALRGIESGPALAGDTVRLGCGCLVRTTPGLMNNESVFVSAQKKYPVSFLAEVATTDREHRPYVEYLGIERATRTAPWKVTFETGVVHSSTPSLDPPDLASGGFTVGSGAADRALAATTAARLAGYYNQAKDTGRIPADTWFEPGAWTTGQARASAAHRNGTAQSNGVVGYLHYTPQPHAGMYFAHTDGETLACGIIRRTARYVAHDGHDPVQDLSRANWGPTVRPGIYQEIDATGDQESCFYVRDEVGGRGTIVVGGDVPDESTVTAIEHG